MVTFLSPYQEELWILQQKGMSSYTFLEMSIDGITDIAKLQGFLTDHIRQFNAGDIPTENGYERYRVELMDSAQEFDVIDEKVAKQIPVAFRIFLFAQEGGSVSLKIYCHQLLADRHSLFVLLENIAHFKNGQKLPDPIPYAKYVAWEKSLVSDSLADYEKRLGSQDKSAIYREMGQIAGAHQRYGSRMELPNGAKPDRYTMLSVLAYLVKARQYHPQIELLVNTGRPDAELRNVLGPVSHYIPLTADPESSGSIDDYLAAVTLEHDLVMSYKEGYYYPSFKSEKQFWGFEFYDKADYQVNLRKFLSTDSFLDVKATFVLTDEALHIDWYYDSSRYSADAIKLISHQYQELLTKLLELPGNSSIESVDGISAYENELVLSDLDQQIGGDDNAPGIISTFKGVVARHAFKTAVFDQGKEITYHELDQLSDALASHLTNGLGLRKGDVALIELDRSYYYVVAVLAALKAGVTYVPIDPSWPELRKNRIRWKVHPKAILTESSLQKEGEASGVATVNLNLELDNLEQVSFDYIQENTSAYILFTSGSTGEPKGCIISQQNLSQYVFWANDAYFNTRGNLHLPFFTSIAFDFTITSILCPLTIGGSLTAFSSEQAIDATFKEIFSEPGKFNAIKLTPSHVQVLKSMDLDLSGLETAIFGGEALKPHQVTLFRDYNNQVHLYNEYGPTEATVGCIVHKIADDFDADVVPIGRPIGGTYAVLLDEQGQLVSMGQPGEIGLLGNNLFDGYFEDYALTSQKCFYLNGSQDRRVYLTGDLGMLLPSGEFQFLGRKDRQVKVHGYRIEPAEIEQVLHLLPGVIEAKIITDQNQSEEAFLSAYLVTTEVEVDFDALMSHLNEHLPTHMVPERFYQLNKLPLNANGKLDVEAMKNGAKPMTRSEDQLIEPKTELEWKLFEIWKEAFGTDEFGVEDKFFDLGGHSLIAVQVLFGIVNELHIEMDMGKVFELQTIRAIAQHLEGQQESEVGEIAKYHQDLHHYPLSPAQLKLWALEQLYPNQTAYINTTNITLKGDCDLDVFEASIVEVWKRHDILRTNFKIFQGEPGQFVNKHDRPEIIHKDFSKVDNPRQAAYQFAVSNRYQSFHLGEDPLLRIALVRVAADEVIFLLAVHHLVFDGWSLEVMFKELCALYNAKVEGDPITLEAPEVQYADYVLWQNAQLEKNQTELISYWQTILRNCEPVKLPEEKGSYATTSFEGSTLSYAVNTDQVAQLTKLGKQHDASLFTVLLTTVNTLLYLQSGQTDLTLVTPTSGRNHPDLDDQIGFFINTIPVRSKLDESRSFTETLKTINQRFREAVDYSKAPFDWVVENINPAELNWSSRAPFNVMIALQNTHTMKSEQFRLKGIETEHYPIENLESRFDLTFNFIEQLDGSMVVNLDYATSKLKDETVSQMVAYFGELLASITENPDGPIKTLEYIPGEEKNTLLNEWNATEKVYSPQLTASQVFAKISHQHAGDRAVTFDKNHLTYEQLAQRASRVARILRSHDIKDAASVGVLMDSGDMLLSVILGIWNCRSNYVPIVKDLPSARVNHIIEECDIQVLVTTNEELDVSVGRKLTRISLSAEDLEKGELLQETPAYDPSDVAYTIFTSGSTGKPKGVPIRHSSLVDRIMYHIDYLKLDNAVKFLQLASLGFDASIAEMLMPILNGGTLVIPTPEEKRNIPLVVDLIQKEAVTAAIFSPSFMNLLQGHNIDSIELIISTGEAASIKQAIYYSQNKRFYNGYGPTESCFGATFYQVESGTDEGNFTETAIPIGKPFANTKVYILNQHHQLSGLGSWGEIAISGVGLSEGYLNNDDLNDSKFMANPFSSDPMFDRIYLTGDIGRWNKDGQLEYAGRFDDQVQIHGVRVEPAEVEQVAKQIAGVKDAVVLAEELENNSKRLVAYVLSPSKVDTEIIRMAFHKELPFHMIPTRVVVLDAFPITVNGKVDKEQLIQIKEGETVATDAPVTAIEQQLVPIWKEILDMQETDVQRHFMDCGGTSLKAIQLISRIYEEMNVKIVLGDFYQYPTIKELSRYISRLSSPETRKLLPYEDQQYYNLSHAQKRIWVLQQYQEDLAFFNMSSVNELSGKIDLGALEGAFTDLMERHEILRSRVTTLKGEPILRTMETADFKVNYHQDLTVEASEKVAEITNYVFDLASENLIKCDLIKTGEDKHIVMVVTHHIVSDGWSMHLMFDELIALYNARLSNRDAELAPLAVQFKDYAIAEQLFQQSDEFEDCRNYWMNQFYRPAARFDFRNDFDRTAVRTFSGGRVEFNIPVDVHMHVAELAQGLKTTQFTVYLSALYMFLHYWTGNKDITLGSDSAGRNKRDLESQLGVFLNTIAMRLQIKSTWTFSMMVKNVHSMMMDAISHESYPFDLLVDELDLSNDLSRSPVFDIFVLNQDIDVFDRDRDMKSVDVEHISAPLANSKFDLSFIFNLGEANPKLFIEYNDGLYLEESINSMFTDYAELLERLLQTMGTTIKDIRNPELSEAMDEQERFLRSMNEV